MAKRPKENQYVPCDCPRCQGALVPQDVYRRHHRPVENGNSFMADDLAILKKVWAKGKTLKEVLPDEFL